LAVTRLIFAIRHLSIGYRRGIGQCSVVMPNSLQKTLSSFDDTYFVPSSPSGSLGKAAIGEILQLATANTMAYQSERPQ